MTERRTYTYVRRFFASGDLLMIQDGGGDICGQVSGAEEVVGCVSECFTEAGGMNGCVFLLLLPCCMWAYYDVLLLTDHKPP